MTAIERQYPKGSQKHLLFRRNFRKDWSWREFLNQLALYSENAATERRNCFANGYESNKPIQKQGKTLDDTKESDFDIPSQIRHVFIGENFAQTLIISILR